ncbi:MAG: cation transporter [Candidatus Accumulibacter sp.]|jgi:copper chaperone|nr:cation transporter [Accumulibacter sp.]
MATTTTIKIEGMSCGGCSGKATRVLTGLPGVVKAEVTLKPGQAVVEFDTARIDREALCVAINDVGFKAS